MKTFNIWVTRRCNLNCRYCYEGKKKDDRNFDENNLEKLFAFILDKSKRQESIHINFHGGEPLLNVKLINIICDFVEKLDVSVSYSMTTNGLLLKEEIIDLIKKNKIYVSISVDGNHIAHDFNRVDYMGQGCYEEVITNLNKCLQYGLMPRIRMTICPDTVSFLKDSILSLISVGCKNIVVVPDFYDTRWNNDLIELINKEIININNIIKLEEVSFAFLESIPVEPKGQCQGGVEEYSIDVDGFIYPCSFAVGNKELCIGNLNEGINYNKLARLIEINKSTLDKCFGCEYEKYCLSTRCKILNKMITGDYLTPSPVVCNFENIVFQQYMFSLSQK